MSHATLSRLSCLWYPAEAPELTLFSFPWHARHAGTWTYSYYSNNGNLNGNDVGMGGDYSFHSANIGWFNANGAVGTSLPAAANLGPATKSFDDTTTAGGVVAATQLQSPTSLYSVGVTSMTFTSSKTGVSVGRFGGFADYDQVTAAATTFQSGTLNAGQQKLNILLTVDGAATWVRATGLPRVSVLAAGAANNVAGSFGTALTIPPYPPRTVGDLTCVHMASKTLGWAVGGNDVTLAQARAGSGAV